MDIFGKCHDMQAVLGWGYGNSVIRLIENYIIFWSYIPSFVIDIQGIKIPLSLINTLMNNFFFLLLKGNGLLTCWDHNRGSTLSSGLQSEDRMSLTNSAPAPLAPPPPNMTTLKSISLKNIVGAALMIAQEPGGSIKEELRKKLKVTM